MKNKHIIILFVVFPYFQEHVSVVSHHQRSSWRLKLINTQHKWNTANDRHETRKNGVRVDTTKKMNRKISTKNYLDQTKLLKFINNHRKVIIISTIINWETNNLIVHLVRIISQFIGWSSIKTRVSKNNGRLKMTNIIIESLLLISICIPFAFHFCWCCL